MAAWQPLPPTHLLYQHSCSWVSALPSLAPAPLCVSPFSSPLHEPQDSPGPPRESEPYSGSQIWTKCLFSDFSRKCLMAMKAYLMAKKEVFSLQASSEFPIIGKVPEIVQDSVNTSQQIGEDRAILQASDKACIWERVRKEREDDHISSPSSTQF